MEVIKALFSEFEDDESTAADATFFTVGEEDDQVVVTLMGLPYLADPTWGVILG